MPAEYANQAIQSVLNSNQAYCKFLSANDSGATGTNQRGILISKAAKSILFSDDLTGHDILKRKVSINWQDDFDTASCFTYYQSKNELRITRFGRNFPLLNPDQTGALFVLTHLVDEYYKGYILDNDDDIDQFLSAFGLSPTETNRLIDPGLIQPEAQEQLAMQEFIAGLTVDFPLSDAMAAAARDIHDRVHDHVEFVRTNPDQKVIDWTNTEYALFRAIEHDRYGARIRDGFFTVDEFIDMANSVLNRRKSRAGKSLEHHLAAVFQGNDIAFTSQAVTEGNKRPDFLFPSQDAYRDRTFPTDRLISLAAKTTCKDRWRQVINEADRLRDRPKYLFTLQQGISPAQMDEMQEENVVLVVPKAYIGSYPADRQNRIWTLAKFVGYVREMEGI